MAVLKYKDPQGNWQTLDTGSGSVSSVEITSLPYGSEPTARITAGVLYIGWPDGVPIDSVITDESDNPVTSAAIYQALQQTPGMAPVQSVNNKTGAVVLDAQDVGAYEKPASGIPASDLAAGVIPDVPVQDVQVDGQSVVDGQGVADIPLGELADRKADVIIASASGAVASFSDGADNAPVKSLIVGIEPVQEGSGDPSPDNVRPISGWTGANISHSGADTTNPTVYPITFPSSAGTVYGGSLTVNEDGTGQLVVETKKITVTSFTAAWRQTNTAYAVYLAVPDGNHITPDDKRHLMVSNEFVYSSSSYLKMNPYEYGGGSGANTTFSFALPKTITSLAEANAWAAANPIEFTYYLTTPLTYSLTAAQIITLFGQNNIWADTGAVSVDYCADTKTYVDDAVPAVPVQDVQVNGVSVLQNGVANVPAASSSAYGVAKVFEALGVDMANGFLMISPAEPQYIRQGTHERKAIVPKYQHEAAFYGLCKAAGADMASSSNPVGTYTDAAKVAIQKMLGIYEAPWELIREDTVTNATEADINITVDGNGESFELTDVYLQVWMPQQETQASIGDYGTVRFYYNDSNYITSQMGTWTQAASASDRFGQVLLTNENGAIKNIVTINATKYSAVNLVGRTNVIDNDALMKIGTFTFTKSVIKKVTGTLKYKLYGKRKWN